jgi:hypothetical protein
MDEPPLTSRVEVRPDGTLAVAFVGKGGVGSAGNQHGRQMSTTLAQALAEHRPSRLLIDLRGLDYQFGDWIASPIIGAASKVGRGRVCVIAEGECWKSLFNLWTFGSLNQLVPLVQSIEEALALLHSQAPAK